MLVTFKILLLPRQVLWFTFMLAMDSPGIVLALYPTGSKIQDDLQILFTNYLMIYKLLQKFSEKVFSFLLKLKLFNITCTCYNAAMLILEAVLCHIPCILTVFPNDDPNAFCAHSSMNAYQSLH